MKKLFIFSFALIISVNAYSQRTELGLFGGVSYYLGNLNPGKQFFLPGPTFGVLYRHNFDSRFAYKLFIAYGMVQGSDAKAKFNVERNLSFRSPVVELSNQIELNFMKFVPGSMGYPFTPYIFSGFSVFYFNPQGEYDGKWYDLQPLGTEGQTTSEYPDKSKYSLVSVAIPIGAGFKFNLSRYIIMGLEWGMRKTYTQYLDDVSTTYADPKALAENGHLAVIFGNRSLPVNGVQQNLTGYERGNSSIYDWYSFAGISITIKIKDKVRCITYEKHFNYKDSKMHYQ